MSIERPRLARCDAMRVRVRAFAFSESFRDGIVNTKLPWMRFTLEHRDIATKNARLSVTLSRLSMDDRVILSPCAMMQHRRPITLSQSRVENAGRFGQTRQRKNFLKTRKAIVIRRGLLRVEIYNARKKKRENTGCRPRNAYPRVRASTRRSRLLSMITCACTQCRS